MQTQSGLATYSGTVRTRTATAGRHGSLPSRLRWHSPLEQQEQEQRQATTAPPRGKATAGHNVQTTWDAS
eukprot:2779226-Amphidinium_carterae.1